MSVEKYEGLMVVDREVVIIGAGVMGCAVAQRFSQMGAHVLVVEAGPRIAEGITSRNSGVIHAGLYYAPHSLKAQACIKGASMLYEWCEKNGVAHRRTQKWVVGASAEQDSLDWLYKNALESGAAAIELTTKKSIQEKFSGLIGAEIGLVSKNTGIVDPYEFSRSLQVSAEENGATFVTDCRVFAVEKKGGDNSGFRLSTSRGTIEAELLINCAGLGAEQIDMQIRGGRPIANVYPCRGDYFRIKKPLPVSTLVYPLKRKNDPGLGVHLTVDLSGGLRLGPDAYYVDSLNDFSDPANVLEKRDEFARVASRYINGLVATDLVYDSCGIRPKLRSPSESAEKDFFIESSVSGYIALLGIESPGLTSALALADHVMELAK